MPQPSELLEDIRDYSSTLETAGNEYYKRWMDEMEEQPPPVYFSAVHFSRQLFVNDVMRYLSRNTLHHAHCDMTFLYEVLRRQLLIRDLKLARIHAYIYGKMSSEHELRRYWGLMLPRERHEMISMYVAD
jgi:hypothetical protein